MAAELPVLPFASAADWVAWLAAQGPGSPGVWVKFAKKSAATPSVSKAEAIDAALCHGWIDGQLAPFDDDWWLIRFTPRKARSKWSEKNRSRALELIAEDRMAPAGLAEVERARMDGRWEAAYAPQSTAEIPPDLQAALDAAPQTARDLFGRLDAVNRYAILHRIHDAKRAETRVSRVEKFVAMLARSETLYPLKGKG